MTNETKIPLAAAAALLALAAVAPAAAQSLEARVGDAPDGWVRFTYEAREGVCGNGDWISVNDDGVRWRGSGCDCRCEEGPVRLELRVRGGEIRDLDAEVGGGWKARSGAVTDLGAVPPAEAAAFLLRVAGTAEEEVAEEAIFPATIARDVEVWPELLELAKGDAPSDVRRQAVFWLGQEASERATEGLTSIVQDEDELEVREHAIFALSQRDEPAAFDALMDVARSSGEPELRKKAIFWLGQKGDDPRVLAFLEEILTGG